MVHREILVTGASGNAGAEVVRLLAQSGAPIRAATRTGALPPDAIHDGLVKPVAFDFMEPATWRDALDGVSRIFLVRPPAISDVKHNINPMIDVAKSMGVEQIVLLSLLGAEKIPVVPHRKIELHIEKSGIPHTFLRASFFMQNLSTTHLEEIRDHNEIAVPAGKGKTSFIDVRDIAAVAAQALTGPINTGIAYDLTGSEALGYDEVARLLTASLGRQITYTDPNPIAFARRMKRIGHPMGFAIVTTAIYLTARFGKADTVTPVTGELLGRPPITMRQFIDDYRDVWL